MLVKELFAEIGLGLTTLCSLKPERRLLWLLALPCESSTIRCISVSEVAN